MPSQLFISRIGGLTRTALCEDGEPVELRVERADEAVRVGDIFKARVSRVVPALHSAFVDLGQDRDGFLEASDLRAGNEILVQVVRDADTHKGVRVSGSPALAGRWLVLLAASGRRGVSRRIRGARERQCLARVVEGLPGSHGYLARTAASGVAGAALSAEAARLDALWLAVEREARGVRAPARVHEELDLALRSLRDGPAPAPERVVVDDPVDVRRAREWAESVDPSLVSRIELHDGDRALFETHGLDRALGAALAGRVPLPSGGYLVIEPTEALVSIDVNSGRSLQGADREESLLATNLEAAREIARQLRLRDLGGLVAVDFIDTRHADGRARSLAALEAALASDPERCRVLATGEQGLVQLTRRSSRADLAARLSRACPSCAGQGSVGSADALATRAWSQILRRVRTEGATRCLVRARADVVLALREATAKDGRLPIAASDLLLEADESLGPEELVVRDVPS